MLKGAKASYTLMSENCDAIINPTPPKSVKDWRSFCGMVNIFVIIPQGSYKAIDTHL